MSVRGASGADIRLEPVYATAAAIRRSVKKITLNGALTHTHLMTIVSRAYQWSP